MCERIERLGARAKDNGREMTLIPLEDNPQVLTHT